MSRGQLGTLLQHLRTLVRSCPYLDVTDGQLLGRSVRDHDETAFEALLQGHGPMVWGVCRRPLRDEAGPLGWPPPERRHGPTPSCMP